MGKLPVIGIDIEPLVTQIEKKHGIGLSTLRLVRAFISNPCNLKFIFYTTSKEPLEQLLPGAEIHYITDSASLPEVLKNDRVDLMHFNDYFFPLYLPNDFIAGAYDFLHTVLTVYDLIPIKFNCGSRDKIENNLFPILDYVDQIRAISNDTKQDIIKYMNLQSKKISVIYHGIDRSVFNNLYGKNEVESIKRDYHLNNTFILQVGSIDWRKNQICLVKAYKLLIENYSQVPDLVFVGCISDYAQIEFVNANGLADKVKFLGIVADEHLPLIINAALVFAYPSLYEGFGNPPLEAMACGIPVIVSDRGSMPEVLGDCPIYIEPSNEFQLADALYQVISKPEIRDEMIRKGLTHVKKYSWNNTASDLADLYLDVLP